MSDQGQKRAQQAARREERKQSGDQLNARPETMPGFPKQARAPQPFKVAKLHNKPIVIGNDVLMMVAVQLGIDGPDARINAINLSLEDFRTFLDQGREILAHAFEARGIHRENYRKQQPGGPK